MGFYVVQKKRGVQGQFIGREICAKMRKAGVQSAVLPEFANKRQQKNGGRLRDGVQETGFRTFTQFVKSLGGRFDKKKLILDRVYRHVALI